MEIWWWWKTVDSDTQEFNIQEGKSWFTAVLVLSALLMCRGQEGLLSKGARVATGLNPLGGWTLQQVGDIFISDWIFPTSDVPVESLRLRFALLQSLNTTLETFFLPLVELRQTEMYSNSIAALLQEAKGQFLGENGCCLKGCAMYHGELLNMFCKKTGCM